MFETFRKPIEDLQGIIDDTISSVERVNQIIREAQAAAQSNLQSSIVQDKWHSTLNGPETMILDDFAAGTLPVVLMMGIFIVLSYKHLRAYHVLLRARMVFTLLVLVFVKYEIFWRYR